MSLPDEVILSAFKTLTRRIRDLEQKEQEPGNVQSAAASATLALTTSAQDVAGATLTLTPGIYSVTGTFTFLTGNDDLDNGFYGVGELVVGGATQAGVARATLLRVGGTSRLQTTVYQTWRVEVSVDTVVKLQARKTGGTGASQALITDTVISATKAAIVG